MMLKAFSLLDTKTGIFNPPQFMHHAAQAIRGLQQIAEERTSPIARHPADFMLVELGGFDDQSGALMAHPSPISLGTVASFIEERRQPGFFEDGGSTSIKM